VLYTPAGVTTWASSATGVRVSGGNTLLVLAGGSAVSATVESGGREVVAGGSATATKIQNGGSAYVAFGGLLSGAVVLAGGSDSIAASGLASYTTLSGGAEVVSDDGVALDTTISAGGAQRVQSGGRVFDATVDAGGTETISSDGLASDTTIAGGSAVVLAGGAITGFVDFAGSGTLGLHGTQLPETTISGFGSGDVIDLYDVALTSSGPATYDATTGALTINEGPGYTLFFDASQDFTGDVFSAFTDGHGGTEITVTCFCAGTRIATPDGETAVEDLRVGDPVRLADGRALPVRWLGVQTVSRRFADPLRVLPIRIATGALDGHLPRRDLRVSPGHALLLDGVLVQAGVLAGFPGIARDHAMPEVFRYYHVELDEHALLLADGVAAESYLDGVEDVTFDNRADRPPNPQVTALDLPRVKAARQLPAALRHRLRRTAA